MFYRRKFAWTAILLIFFVGCSDLSGPDEEEAPSVPEFHSEETSPDLSLYKNNGPGGETMSNYNEAHGVALTMQFAFAIVEGLDPFFEEARSEDNKNFNDGVWEWSYSDTYDGTSVEMRLTAEKSETETSWSMFWTFDDGEGNSYEDAEVLEGTVANDGSEASWIIRSPNSSTGEVMHVLDYNWSNPGDDQLNIMVTGYNDDGTESGSFEYDQSGSEHTLHVMEQNEEDITVFWNSETNAGYIEQGSVKECWDENLQNTPCT